MVYNDFWAGLEENTNKKDNINKSWIITLKEPLIIESILTIKKGQENFFFNQKGKVLKKDDPKLESKTF